MKQIELRPGSWATASREDTSFNLCGRGFVGRHDRLPPDVAMVVEWQEYRTRRSAPPDLTLSYAIDPIP